MLRLERHLTEDELLALRDGRDDDRLRVSHLEGCPRCQRRLGFLSAFKAAARTSLEASTPASGEEPQSEFLIRSEPMPALEGWSPVRPFPGPAEPSEEEAEGEEEEDFPIVMVDGEASDSDLPAMEWYPVAPTMPAGPPAKPAGDHPDPATLAAYFDGALADRERSRVQRHLLGCERCMADTLVLVAGRGEGDAGEDLRAARAYFGKHGSALAYPPRTASRQVRPQLELGLQDGIGTEVIFRILSRPGRTSRPRPPSRDVDDRVEVMVGTVRVTIAAHREGRARFLDVQVRDLGRPASPPPAAEVSLEEEGRTVESVPTGGQGKASLRVPDLPCFDLRVSGGWEIPVLLRFRA